MQRTRVARGYGFSAVSKLKIKVRQRAAGFVCPAALQPTTRWFPRHGSHAAGTSPGGTIVDFKISQISIAVNADCKATMRYTGNAEQFPGQRQITGDCARQSRTNLYDADRPRPVDLGLSESRALAGEPGTRTACPQWPPPVTAVGKRFGAVGRGSTWLCRR